MKNTALQELNLNHFTLKTMNWLLTSEDGEFKYIMINKFELEGHGESLCFKCIGKLPCHPLNSNSPHEKIHHCNWSKIFFYLSCENQLLNYSRLTF